MKKVLTLLLIAVGIGCHAQQSQKVNTGKQTLDQIRAHMPNRINELIERGDVTFFEDGKEISGSKALALAEKVRDGERDMILTTISGSKTTTMWANIRSLIINEDYTFSLKYEENYPGRTTFN